MANNNKFIKIPITFNSGMCGTEPILTHFKKAAWNWMDTMCLACVIKKINKSWLSTLKPKVFQLLVVE